MMCRKMCFLGVLMVLVFGTGWTSFAHAEALPSRVAYVTNSDDDTVSVISLATRQVVATINVGDYPLAVAVTPDAQRVYVTNVLSDSVSVIDAVTGGVIATITDGIGDAPWALAVSRDGSRVYVANQENPGSISVIDTATNTVVKQVTTTPNPSALAFHPVRDELWVGYNIAGNVVLDARSADDDNLSLLASVSTGTGSGARSYASYDLVFRADGSEAFGAEGCGECGRFHRISGTLSDSSISILQPDILYGNPAGFGYGVAINPTGVAYLGKGRSVYEGTNSRIVEFGGQERTLEFGYYEVPTDIAFETEDCLIYVVRHKWDTSGSVIPGSVSIVDPDTFSITATVNVGRRPSGIALGLRPADLCDRLTTSDFGEPMGKKKKLGSTLPVKFNLFFDGVEVTSQQQLEEILTENGCEADSPHIVIKKVLGGDVDLPEDDGNVGEGGDLGDSFRYSDGNWIFNLALPEDPFYSGTAYKVTVEIGECECKCVLTPGNELFMIK